jgi:hypothetical protein
MKLLYYLISGFLNLFNVVLTSNVIIKWLTNDSLTESITLTRTFPPQTKFRCEWWKLVENKRILETGEEFIYGDRRFDCSLIIVKFDFKKDHLDVYKPINTLTRTVYQTNSDPVFIIAYLKSFELLKSKKSSSIHEYTCRAKFLFPNYDESLAEDIIKSLEETLKINGKELNDLNRNNSQKESSFKSVINNMKDLFKKKPKRDIGANEISLESDKVDVFVSGKNPSIFECSIQLIDKLNKKVVYSNLTREFPSLLEKKPTETSTKKSIFSNFKDLFRKKP